MTAVGPLGLSETELSSCVQCGLCLPHCPTYRISGLEAHSPRGRIDAMRDVQWRGFEVDGSFIESMDTCVGCRGCETACPSAVPFGHLMDETRAALSAGATLSAGAYQGRWHRLAYRSLAHPRILRAGALVAAVAGRMGLGGSTARRLIPQLGNVSKLPVRRGRLSSTGNDVVLVTGCVMDALQREVHSATVDVLGAAGLGVAIQAGPGCCGALAAHAGLRDLSRQQTEQLIDVLPVDIPVVVDSAGCSAHLSEIGNLVGSADSHRFSARVHDVTEVLASRVDVLIAAVQATGRVGDRSTRPPVAIQDPCHLRHAQRGHGAVRVILEPFFELVELDDEGLCCGAGGAFSLEHPADANAIRDLKLAAIARTGAAVVASANPGCSMHLAAAGVDVRHPVQLLAGLLSSAPDR